MTTEQGMNDWLGLANSVHVVTGAASGIGAAIACALAVAGARVVLLDRDLEGCEAVQAKLADSAGRHMSLACDVANENEVQQAAQAVAAAMGQVDGLVNGAGILQPGKLADMTIAQWQHVLAVNLTGYWLCAREFGHQMREQQCGSIVHISSVSASQPQTWSGAYSPSKAGVAMLSRQLAAEWGREGIRSNCVSPGMIKTDLSATFYAQPGITQQREVFTANRRIGQPDDIANAVLFLLSRRADYINGADLGVDGGLPCMLMDQVPRPGFSAH
ncbi:SDR family NAD(P)-dependent oxidoreductase [Vreelandella olivaria]|uniref:SDR family NAD(P)-dependent oxidoreductase n=1 Tax=Vreelandella olivaria TaxID=390919 RepID=UPI00201EE283|nr:SDR family oxidoreductase [Halomonas olivaria]